MVKRAVNRQEYSPRYHTVAHEFLELKELPGVETLDLILDEAAATISAKDYSEEEIPAVVENIEQLLTKNGRVKTKEVIYLNREQEKRQLYANAGPLVCMAIAEVLDLPYAAVLGRNVIISWNLPQAKYVNKVISFQSPNQEEFDAVSENDNLDGLDRDKLLAIYYTNIGKAWIEKRGLQRAISCFDKAIELTPQSVYPYQHRSTAHLLMGDFKKASLDLVMVYELQ